MHDDDSNPFDGVSHGIHDALATLLQYLDRPGATASGIPVHEPIARRALAYLEAVTPYNHRTRGTVLKLADTMTRWRAHGGPADSAEQVDAVRLLSTLARLYDEDSEIPEVYTLNSVLDVDTWLSEEDRPEVTVRLVDSEGAIGLVGASTTRLPLPGHRSATLVFYMQGLPHAQITVNHLLRMSSPAAAFELASQPHDQCGHQGCTHAPAYIVMLGDYLLVSCVEHLAHALHPHGGYVIPLSPV